MVLSRVIPHHGKLCFDLLRNQSISRQHEEADEKPAISCALENVEADEKPAISCALENVSLLGHVQNDSFLHLLRKSLSVELKIWSLSVTLYESPTTAAAVKKFTPCIFKHTRFLVFYIVWISAERRRLKLI